MYLFPPKTSTPTKGDWQTEYEACKAFDRPPRNDLKKPPFYPWMPPTFNVKFSLNYK